LVTVHRIDIENVRIVFVKDIVVHKLGQTSISFEIDCTENFSDTSTPITVFYRVPFIKMIVLKDYKSKCMHFIIILLCKCGSKAEQPFIVLTNTELSDVNLINPRFKFK